MTKIPCKGLKEINLNNQRKIIKGLKRKPKLVTLLCANNASNVYVRNKELAVEYVTAECETVKIDPNITYETFKQLIIDYGNDPTVDGILIQLPLYPQLTEHETELLNLIPAEKDVDGFTKANVEKQKDYLIPCTVYGIMEIFKYYNYSLSGKAVLVIGRGTTCARPLIKELDKANATVLWANSKTSKKLLKKLIFAADVVVSAVGNESFLIDDSYFLNGKILDFIIDVGIVRKERGIRGDFDFSAYQFTDYYTTTPGGTGQLTVSYLMNNLIQCYKLNGGE